MHHAKMHHAHYESITFQSNVALGKGFQTYLSPLVRRNGELTRARGVSARARVRGGGGGHERSMPKAHDLEGFFWSLIFPDSGGAWCN